MQSTPLVGTAVARAGPEPLGTGEGRRLVSHPNPPDGKEGNNL
jgi:hypothetical protein